ncbi:polysaccharide deacetylase family protein [Ktedonospora formicarum]|uniref:polysaccharide deacetylase family protein n=1 Tax=Ktedonospora formicarum TaxID=2778364 RepID=UPI001C68F889
MLAALCRHGILSTFFVIGDRLCDRRALTERAHAEGHWIGNHTYNHLAPLGLASKPGAAASEIAHPGADRQSRPSAPFFPACRHWWCDRMEPSQRGGDRASGSGRLHLCALEHDPRDCAFPNSWVERAIKRVD